MISCHEIFPTYQNFGYVYRAEPKKGCLVYYYETASLALQDGLEPTTP